MIMAGGGGTRLWPMSRSDMPKQLLPLVEDYSMFRVSVQRLAPLFAPEQIFVVAGRNHVDALRADAPEIPAENFIVEPFGRDSGPAAALGISVIQKRDPEATVAILTADHHIADKERFRDVLHAACEVAQDHWIVTLGISPSLPSTAFGYIRRGESIRDVAGFRCYHALGFTEKPNTEKAIQFIRSGEYSWNSGMFIWRADRAMAEFRQQQPEIYRLMQQLLPAIDTPDYDTVLDRVWEVMPRISIDFAVMEGADRVAVIPVDIGWSDVGSWDALFDVIDLDPDGNVFKGASPNRITVDTRNTLIYSDKLTVTIGIDNLVIVDTPDVLMICHRDRTQDVKQVVAQLRETDNAIYL
jgi:mannose-1-phosphate guanylyltransferase